MKVSTALNRIEVCRDMEQVRAELERIREDLELEAIKAGKVRIVDRRTDAGTKKIKVTPYGDYVGVYRSDTGSWIVLHIPTGLAFRALLTKADATRMARKLCRRYVKDELNNPDAGAMVEQLGDELKQICRGS
ncbi:MAG: hypothetical protein P8012_00115 [Desulfobacterales bacterium]